MNLPHNYARDFKDDILQDKYEEELYKNNQYKAKIRLLKANMEFYIISAVWLLAILIFPKFCIGFMALALYLSYKLEFLNKKYYYQIGIMFILAAAYVLQDLWPQFAPFVVTRILYIIIAFVFLITAVVSTIRFVVLTEPSFAGVSGYFGRNNLGRQVIESNDKLYKLESELNARKKVREEQELSAQLKQLETVENL